MLNYWHKGSKCTKYRQLPLYPALPYILKYISGILLLIPSLRRNCKKIIILCKRSSNCHFSCAIWVYFCHPLVSLCVTALCAQHWNLAKSQLSPNMKNIFIQWNYIAIVAKCEKRSLKYQSVVVLWDLEVNNCGKVQLKNLCFLYFLS